MRNLLMSILICAATPVMAQDVARTLVCPPSLNYCYHVERPVRAGIRGEDLTNSMQQVMDCIYRNPLLIAECRARYGLPY